MTSMQNNTLRIRFEWFEPWFDKKNNFFTRTLIEKGFSVEVFEDHKTGVDLEFVSVYPPLRRDLNARLHRLRTRIPVWQKDTTETYPLQFEPNTSNFTSRVWYTSENIRPPYQKDLDLTLSFDQDAYGGRNFYLPLWQLHLDHQKKFGRPLNPNSSLGKDISINELLSKRVLGRKSLSDRKFACVFLANPQPTRLRLIDELSKYGEVDVFGLYSGNSIPNKFDVASNYNFMICPENDLFPGYVTEKLLDAYICETVPLYWGDLGADKKINRNAHLNLREFESIEDFAKKAASITFDEYRKLYEQPFLTESLDFHNLAQFLVSGL
jgi:hypothetical protein